MDCLPAPVDLSVDRDEAMVRAGFQLGCEYERRVAPIREDFDRRIKELVAASRLGFQPGVPQSDTFYQISPLPGSLGEVARDPDQKPSDIHIHLSPTSTGAPSPMSTDWRLLRDEFFKDRPGLTEKTIGSYGQAFAEFFQLVGHAQVSLLRKADLKGFANHLRDRPNGRGGQLNRKTIDRSLSHIKNFLVWCSDNQHAADEAWGSVSPRDPTEAEKIKVPRRAFRPEELKALFHCPIFLTPKTHDDLTTAWFFILSVLTGGRTEELVNAPAEFIRVGKIDCLDLRESGSKTAAAPRLVPLIKDLVELGIHEWAAAQRNRGFTLLQSRTPNRSEGAWSTHLNRVVDKYISEDTTIAAYSSRHCFRQMLRASGTGDELSDKVFGHSTGKTGAGYGRELSPDEAARVFKLVKAPLDLVHLKGRLC